jgi:hypothetical protein
MSNDLNNETHRCLMRQFEMAWKLTSYHLDGLTTEECLWRPAAKGLHVWQTADERWLADWPEHEGYDLGPASIAWLTWHMGFWWSMIHNHTFGDGTVAREDIHWPGSADAVRHWLEQLQQQWQSAIQSMTDEDLKSSERTRWPFRNRPFGDVIAWVNLELTKNAAEIGYARFLYTVHKNNA